jgi:hypothetical protein
MSKKLPIAAKASTGRGTKAAYHKEGIDPGECYAHQMTMSMPT